MNFALNVSNKVEMELIQRMAPTLEKSDMIDPMQEELIYREAFNHVIQSDPRIRGAGGDIRVGEFILIVDSDTRIVSWQRSKRFNRASTNNYSACRLPSTVRPRCF